MTYFGRVDKNEVFYISVKNYKMSEARYQDTNVHKTTCMFLIKAHQISRYVLTLSLPESESIKSIIVFLNF